MRCDDMRAWMSAHLDGCLDDVGEQRLAAHLAACASCQRELEELQRVVKRLQHLEPVAPPPDLTVRIHARLRSARRSNLLVFLNLPQTRVVLAASLVMVLTVIGIRQMYATRPYPAESAMPSKDTTDEDRRPASARPPLAPPRPADAGLAFQVENRQQAEPDTKACDFSNEKMADQALRRDEARVNLKTEALPADGTMPRGRVVASVPGATDSVMLQPGPAEYEKKETVALREESSRQPVKRIVVTDDIALPGGYTFRTGRLREAAAIVRRHERKAAGGVSGGAYREASERRKEANAETPQQVVMDVLIPPAEVAGLLEELRQAGAVLVSAPAFTDGQAAAAEGGRASRGSLFKAAAAAADAPIAAPAAVAAETEVPTGLYARKPGVASASAAPAASATMVATPVAPATSVWLRLVFMPLAP